MDFLNFLGIIAFVLTLVAMYLVGKPNKFCFIFFCISQIIQIFIFYKTCQWFLILTMIALIVFNVINYYRWEKQGVG
jgi:nicotinamide riboside transporter PnuC